MNSDDSNIPPPSDPPPDPSAAVPPPEAPTGAGVPGVRAGSGAPSNQQTQRKQAQRKGTQPKQAKPPKKPNPRQSRVFIIVGSFLSLVALGLLIVAIIASTMEDETSDSPVTTTTTTTTTVAPESESDPAPEPPEITVVTPIVPPVEEPEVEPTPTTAPEPEFPLGFPTPEQWVAFRDCQTGGDYTFVNPAGTNFGAYQFRIATWDELASRRYPELVGVTPSDAAPQDQDKMGFALWEERGADPWPGCAHTITTADPSDTGGASTTQGDTTSTPTTTTVAPAASNYDPDALGPIIIPSTPGFPSPEQWAALRQCQAGGDYTFVNPAGTHFGAYQFRISTWDELASRKFPSLVGVQPSVASPRDQDRVAYNFWLESGASRWPACGYLLGAEAPVSDAANPNSQPAQTTTTTTTPETLPIGPPAFPTIPDLSPTSTTPTASQWANLRQCESLGNYTVVSSDGLHYGAYQFTIQTWNDVASRHAPRLVGVLPSQASVADQDFLAQKLYDERSWTPWPVCGARHLR